VGIFDRITGQASAQFLDVIEWVDDTRDTLVYRYPIHDRAITDQSKVIVREGQQALFIAEGALSEVFGPGTYTLDTPNAPILTFFRSIAYAMETPYKGDIVFVNTRQFTENRWGTQAPFMMRDAEFGPVRVRAFGTFSFRVIDAAHFLPESNAACWYLATGSHLVPGDRFEQANTLRWMFFEQYNHEPNIATLRFWLQFVGKNN